MSLLRSGGLLAALAGALLACSSEASPPAADGGTDPGACPNDLPASCETPAPSFRSQVEPVFVNRCYACHAGSGVEAQAHDLSTYASIFAQRSAILNQVYACRMPPADAARLTAEERALLLSWLVCQAPDN